MMETSDHRLGDDDTVSGRLRRSAIRRIPAQPLVRPRAVVVAEEIADESQQVPFAEDNDVIQALAAERADEPLGVGVLPGRAQGGEDLPDVHAPKTARDVLAEDRVVVVDQEAWGRVEGEGLEQLPDHPRRGRVGRDVEVQDVPPMVGQNK